MRSRTRNTLLAAAAVLLAALLAIVSSAGSGAGAPARFGEADLELVDVAELELARAERAPATAPTAVRSGAAVGAPRGELLMRGTVFGGGRPLEGATVHLELRTDGGRAGQLVRVRRPAVTGADGGFVLEGLAPIARHAVLVIRHPAFAPAIREVGLSVDRPRIDVGEVVMSVGGAIVGRITDPGGAPIDAADVSVRPVDGNPLDRASRWDELLAPRTTLADGSFAFERLPAGAYRVDAIARDRQRTALAEPVRIADSEVRDIGVLPLPRGFAVSGEVTAPDGLPVGGAEVRLQESPGARETPPVREVAHADDGGSFRFEHLPARRLRLEVVADGFLSRRVDVTPTGDGGPIVVELARGLTITGSVRDRRNGAPITWFAVAARAADPSRDAVDGFDPRRVPTALGAATDHPGGAFEIDGLDAGWYRVEVIAPSVGFAHSDAFELAPGSPPPLLALTIEAATAIEGIARAAADRRALPGVRVTVLERRDLAAAPPAISVIPAEDAAPRTPIAATRTGADGTFRVEHLAAGRYLLVAEAEPFIPIEVEVDAGQHGVELELVAPATLVGSVSGAEQAVTSARVIAYGGPLALYTARVASDGSFRIDEMRPGGYVVRAFVGDARDVLLSRIRAATDPSGAPLDVDVVLRPGDVRELALDARPPALGSIHGRVLENGAPAAGCEVSLRIDAGSGRPRWIGRRFAAATATDGSFTLVDVPAGSYALIVEQTTPGRPEIHREGVVVRDGARSVVEAAASTGTLDVTVTAPDRAAEEQLTGNVRLLSGSTASTVDAAQSDGPTRHATLRGDRASFAHAPAGPALVVIEVRGRARVVRSVVVPTRGERASVTIDAGPRTLHDR